MNCDLGFRIVGPCTAERKLVGWQRAFCGYATLDKNAKCDNQSYLSAFTFGEDFKEHLSTLSNVRGFDGVCGAKYIWFDIDNESSLNEAKNDTIQLCQTLFNRYALNENDVLSFFSGAKGFHIGLPTAVWTPLPSLTFNRVTRRFAEQLAAQAGVTIDTGVYDKVRAFRAPNSRHPRTNLHKRFLTMEQIRQLSIEEIMKLATVPQKFTEPTLVETNKIAEADWKAAMEGINFERLEMASHRIEVGETPLNRSTLDFIRNGAPNGERHRRLYSAASNLAECRDVGQLTRALLFEAAMDTGLPPSEVRRVIQDALNHKNHKGDS